MSKHSVSIEGVETEVSTFAREISAKRATILGFLALLLTVSVGQGWIDIHTSEQITKYVTYGLGLSGTIGAGLWIRTATTVADPKLKPLSNQGEPMAPISQLANVVPSFDHLSMDELPAAPSLDHLTMDDTTE